MPGQAEKDVQDILPLLQQMTQQGRREMVILAADVDGEALATLGVNTQREILHVLAVGLADLSGYSRTELLEDIASLTGGQISETS